MKKRDLSAIAMICTSAALLIGACGQSPTSGGTAPAANGQMSASNQAFYNILNGDAQKKFKELDPRRQQAAIDQAAQGTDANQAVNNQYDAMKQGARPPITPGNAPTPPAPK